MLGTRGIPAQYGGFETFAEEIGARLVEKGIQVTVFCEQVQGREQPTAYRDMRLVYVPSPSLGPFRTILFDLLCASRAYKGFDVFYVLAYGASLFCFIPCLWGSQVWINIDGVD